MVIQELNSLKQLLSAEHIMHMRSYSPRPCRQKLSQIALTRGYRYANGKQSITEFFLYVVHLVNCTDIMKKYVIKGSNQFEKENTSSASSFLLSLEDPSTSNQSLYTPTRSCPQYWEKQDQH